MSSAEPPAKRQQSKPVGNISDRLEKAMVHTCPEWKKNIKEILFSKEELDDIVSELADQINAEYCKYKEPIICVGLLKGAFVFVADILRKFSFPFEIEFMVVSSYGTSSTTTGSVKLKKDIGVDPAGRHVLILEDLIDTGTTLAWIRRHIMSKKCKSVKVCCLLDKPERRSGDVKVDYVGRQCPDEFVVGYGMDFAEQYRVLPYVAALKPEAYMKK